MDQLDPVDYFVAANHFHETRSPVDSILIGILQTSGRHIIWRSKCLELYLQIRKQMYYTS